jgi:uncharacterized protein YcbK (DUF882 family)
MSGLSSVRLTAAFCLAVSVSPAAADNAIGFFSQQQNSASPNTAGPVRSGNGSAARAEVVAGNVHRLQRGNAGGIKRQTGHVSTACLRSDLVGILRRASNHFGSEAVITSGFRRGRGYHAKCMAADVQMAGVSPGTLARYFRSQSGVGGVGTYGHTRSVHVDVASRVYSWHGRSSRRVRVADACPCCGGSQHGAKSSFSCERSVIAPDAIKLGAARG